MAVFMAMNRNTEETISGRFTGSVLQRIGWCFFFFYLVRVSIVGFIRVILESRFKSNNLKKEVIRNQKQGR